MRVLFLSAWYPYPPDNGSKLRIYNLLRGISARHEVSLISFVENDEQVGDKHLPQMLSQVETVPVRQYSPTSSRALLGLLSNRPRVLVDRFSPEMDWKIRSSVTSGHYDVVIASQWYMADYLRGITGPPAIFEEAEVGIFADKVARAGSFPVRMRHRLTQLKMQAYFRRLLRRFAACTVVSEQERRLMKTVAPDYESVFIIPNGVRLDEYKDVSVPLEPDTLVYTGSFTYRPNYEAMLWFMKNVFPLLRARRPAVRVMLTGEHKGLPLPGEPAITRTGFVDDVRPYIAGAWAALAPLQMGGGTRLKILEAMAVHTPVIATSKGAEGLDVVPGEHILLADSPDEFALSTARVLGDRDLRDRLAANAFQLVKERYDWSVILPDFFDLAEGAAKREHVEARRYASI